MFDVSEQRNAAPRRAGKWVSRLLRGLAWGIMIFAVLWAAGALYFDFPVAGLRGVAVILWLMACVAIVLRIRPWWRALSGLGIGIVLVLFWWRNLEPQSQRDWKPEVSRLPRAVVEGDRITLHEVRDFDYRTEEDFTPAWKTRTVHLSHLRGADVFITYWGSPYMAHPIISFDFGDEGRLCFSIETRQEKGEGYSAPGGLYRRFELIYVVAEERDVIRLRTNYRKGEDVYLYRLAAPQVKESFMEYVGTLQDLHEKPRWYNAITNNCTSAIRHQRAAERRSGWDWRMLVNGFGDELLYERGAIDQSRPFAELKAMSRINDKARAADGDPDFSHKIREGLPGME